MGQSEGAIDDDASIESERRGFDALYAFARSHDLIAILDLDGRVLACSRSTHEGRAFLDLIAQADVAATRAALDRVRSGGSPVKLDVSMPVPGGSPEFHQLSVSPVEREGRVVALAVVAAEITTRRETEDRLRRAEALLVDTQGTAHLGTWEWDVRQPHATWSDELYRIYGLTRDEYTPSYEAYLQKVHPDDRAHVMAATERVFREHEPYSHDERIVRPDGSIRYLHTWAHAILDDQGRLERLIGVCQDITDRKLAELERARVEDLLWRSQKLEAIGRLAGGIAHDFNNMLSVVSGYTGMLLARLPGDAPYRKYLAEIMGAVDRSARMTQQLLAFGREPMLERGPVDLNRVVRDMTDMLRRLIGEDIELEIALQESAPAHIEANRSQIEQVIVNLVVNARDAMPNGGRLTITTSPIEVKRGEVEIVDLVPGEYLALVVRDTGCGISDEVQAQMFDPFFTTKPEGKGTGLGLSTVYGIVKQSGGAVTVSSRLGHGTEFTTYFRRVEPRSEAIAKPPERLGDARGIETVLLVEDHSSVRAVVREALEGFGYTVLEADGPIEALRISREHVGVIDALVTDAVMPGMSGRELATALTAERPSLRVLFMSGHTNDVALRRGGVAFLPKPFTPTELGDRLRAVLDTR